MTNLKLNAQFEQCMLVESISGLDKHLHPYELQALKKHSNELAKREKVRLARISLELKEAYREARIAANARNYLSETKWLKTIYKLEGEL